MPNSSDVVSGQLATAAQHNALRDDIFNGRVRKTADETVNNSSTLQNDDHLLVALSTNANYFVMLRIDYISGTTPDFKVGVTLPSGATSNFFAFGINTAGAVMAVQFGASIAFGGEGASSSACWIVGWVKTGVTAGNLQVQWAQNTADVSDTTVHEGSWLNVLEDE